MRYLFNVERELEEIRDDVGLELDSLEEAKAEAVGALADIIKSGVPERDQRVIAIRVRGVTRQTALKASLTLAVEQVQGA